MYVTERYTNPTATILTGCHNGIIRAIKQRYANSTHRGCFFHFTQCIFRKIHSTGLNARYKAYADFILKLQLSSAIAYVPTANVANVVNTFASKMYYL